MCTVKTWNGLDQAYSFYVCLANRGCAWSKNRYEFFSKMLNGERSVDLKHKPLEDKEVTEIEGHQELSIHER